VLGESVLEELLAQPELPDLEPLEEPELSKPVGKRKKVTKVTRTDFRWEARSFHSKSPPLFPEPRDCMRGSSTWSCWTVCPMSTLWASSESATRSPVRR
jgi:hypothetical protein